MNILRSFQNKIISMPVKHSWLIDVEAYCSWLNDFDKDANKTWARYRRMSLIAFANYYGNSIPEIKSYFINNHLEFKRYPAKYDFEYAGYQIKIVPTNVNEKWNIGPLLHSRLTEKAYAKNNDYYVLVAYDISRISIIGWMTHEMAGMTKNRGYYEIHERDCLQMDQLELLNSKDNLRWYY